MVMKILTQLLRDSLNGAFSPIFSSSSIMTTIHRETAPSGKCIIEKKVQQSFNQNEKKNKTETITKICGDKHYTIIRGDGNIARKYVKCYTR